MNTSLYFRHGALHIPCNTNHRSARLALSNSISNPSLFLSSRASTFRSLSRHGGFASPVTCAQTNKPLSPPWPNYTNKENCKRVTQLLLACVIGFINCNFVFISPLAFAREVERASYGGGGGGGVVLTRPKDVLDSMLKVTKHVTSPKEGRMTRFRKSLKSTPRLTIPDRPSPEDREKLKIAVADLIKSGKCDEAETQLKELYESTKPKGGEPAKDVEMELVLVLILQGKYQEALDRHCFHESFSPFSDGRVHFYKAIILTMLDKDEEAEECWDNFISAFSVRGLYDDKHSISAIIPGFTPKHPRKPR